MYIVTVILAAGFFAIGWIGRTRYLAMARTRTVTCAELTARPRYSAKCEVTGTVNPGGGGLVIAPFSGTPCVWYRAKATAKWRSGGKNEFHDERSEQAFTIFDGTGVIEVFPGEHMVDGAVKTIDRKAEPRDGDGLPTPNGRHEEYTHYHYEEWTLPAGSPMYALGMAVYDGQRLSMQAVQEGETSFNSLILSTRSESRLRRRALFAMVAGYGGGTLLLAASVFLVIVQGLADD